MISRTVKRKERGFTMVELLTVVAIMVILGALVVASPNLWRSNNLTVAGNQVMEDLALARELAVSSNEPTEVWFLRPTGGTLFTGSQIYQVDQTGIWSPYGGVHSLPKNVGADSGTALSSLFASSNKKAWGSQAQASIPSYGTSYDAYAIRFMPDGSVGSASKNLFLTLHDISRGDQLATLPANYSLINIDFVTGAVTLYRP